MTLKQLVRSVQKSIPGYVVASLIGTVGTLVLIDIARNAVPSATDRRPAVDTSANPKRKILKPIEDSETSESLAKNKGPIQVQLLAQDDEPFRAGRTYRLSGTVSSNMDLDGLRYEWVLPEGVTLVSGDASGQFHVIKAGEPRALEIAVSQNDETNKQIYLHAYFETNGERIGDIKQFNSTLNKSLAERIHEKSLQLQENDGNSAPQKIYQ